MSTFYDPITICIIHMYIKVNYVPSTKVITHVHVCKYVGSGLSYMYFNITPIAMQMYII